MKLTGVTQNPSTISQDSASKSSEPDEINPEIELTDMKAAELVAYIKSLDPATEPADVTTLQGIIDTDTRSSVLKAAKKKLSE